MTCLQVEEEAQQRATVMLRNLRDHFVQQRSEWTAVVEEREVKTRSRAASGMQTGPRREEPGPGSGNSR